MPAFAGMTDWSRLAATSLPEIPAFAGMTKKEGCTFISF
jgi:hypothetical protein